MDFGKKYLGKNLRQITLLAAFTATGAYGKPCEEPFNALNKLTDKNQAAGFLDHCTDAMKGRDGDTCHKFVKYATHPRKKLTFVPASVQERGDRAVVVVDAMGGGKKRDELYVNCVKVGAKWLIGGASEDKQRGAFFLAGQIPAFLRVASLPANAALKAAGADFLAKPQVFKGAEAATAQKRLQTLKTPALKAVHWFAPLKRGVVVYADKADEFNELVIYFADNNGQFEIFATSSFVTNDYLLNGLQPPTTSSH